MGHFTSPAPNTLLTRNTPGDSDQSIPESLALRPGYPAPVVLRLWSFPEMKGVANGSLITASVCSLALQTNSYGHLGMIVLW